MNAIKAVIWDLSGVVLHTVKGTFYSLMAERLGAPLKDVERLMSSTENKLWDLGEMTDDTFYTFILKGLNMPMEKKSILRKFVLDDFYIDQEILAYIKKIHKSFTTVLLTNFPKHVHDFMKTDWIVDGAFDHIIASCDVKLIKPDPAIYKLTLARIGCQAEESVFIDDWEKNVKAAEKLGIIGIIYQSQSQIINDLDAILQR
ncbi:MAG: HAD family phosphatase [Anaerolineaceae bacterium]|nr:HAD family phosphatase [Anaerolineaceae bacterium]